MFHGSITLIFILMVTSAKVFAATLEIIGACDETPVFSTIFSIRVQDSKSIGKVSVDIFDQNYIPYLGTEEGMNSILNTPVGKDAIEVISSTEYLAYGWCYKVNDIEPGEYPHEIVAKNNDSIVWWFGYARYKDGQWIEQCTPSHVRKSAKFCP